jgi:translation elongation factor EF-Tu-like GTPase
MGLFSRKPKADESPPTSGGGYQPGTWVPGQVVVSATDGPMPATRDAFEAVRSGGGASVDVQLINTDLVDDQELLELVELEIRELASSCGLTVDNIERT